MKLWLAAFAVGLAVAGQVQAATLSCNEALARVDTFGRLRWKDPVKVPPTWADKELKAGTATPWPWGLEADDGPADVKAKLLRLLPNEGSMSGREGGLTYNLDIADCMVWIEVTFQGERGIKAVSLNAQP